MSLSQKKLCKINDKLLMFVFFLLSGLNSWVLNDFRFKGNHQTQSHFRLQLLTFFFWISEQLWEFVFKRL